MLPIFSINMAAVTLSIMLMSQNINDRDPNLRDIVCEKFHLDNLNRFGPKTCHKSCYFQIFQSFTVILTVVFGQMRLICIFSCSAGQDQSESTFCCPINVTSGFYVLFFSTVILTRRWRRRKLNNNAVIISPCKTFPIFLSYWINRDQNEETIANPLN